MINLHFYRNNEFLGRYAWGLFNWQNLELKVVVTENLASFVCDLSHLYPIINEEGVYVHLQYVYDTSNKPILKETLEAFIETVLIELEREIQREISIMVKKLKACLASAEKALSKVGGYLDPNN